MLAVFVWILLVKCNSVSSPWPWFLLWIALSYTCVSQYLAVIKADSPLVTASLILVLLLLLIFVS